MNFLASYNPPPYKPLIDIEEQLEKSSEMDGHVDINNPAQQAVANQAQVPVNNVDTSTGWLSTKNLRTAAALSVAAQCLAVLLILSIKSDDYEFWHSNKGGVMLVGLIPAAIASLITSFGTQYVPPPYRPLFASLSPLVGAWIGVGLVIWAKQLSADGGQKQRD